MHKTFKLIQTEAQSTRTTTTITTPSTITTITNPFPTQTVFSCNKAQYDLTQSIKTFTQFDNVKPVKLFEIIEISNKSMFIAFDHAAKRSNYLFNKSIFAPNYFTKFF